MIPEKRGFPMQLRFWKTRAGCLAVDAYWHWGFERSVPASGIFWNHFLDYGRPCGPDYPFLV